MKFQSNKKLTPYSQGLRKNMTKEEQNLWYKFLKKLPVQFYRQKVIGNYIVDFMCVSAKLIVELDGSQHYEDEAELNDAIRDSYMKNLGYTVLRFSNLEVNRNFDNVCAEIYRHLNLSD